MNTKKAEWENWFNLALGIWLFMTPWLMPHNLSSEIAMTMNWNFWIVGAIVAITAGLALRDLQPWEEWVNLALGIYVFLSPVFFGYAEERGLMLNSVVVGLAIAVFAGLAIPIAQKLQRQ